jgi:hypothetical protein
MQTVVQGMVQVSGAAHRFVGLKPRAPTLGANASWIAPLALE